MVSFATDKAICSLLGAILAFVNIPVIVLIFCSPALQKCKELVLIGGICAVDAFLAMSNSVSAMDRIINFPNGTEQQMLQMECFFRYYVVAFFYANLLVGFMALLVSVERFIAVFFPLYYMSLYTRKMGFCIMAGVTILITISFAGAYHYQTVVPNTMINVLCYTAFVYPPLVSNLLTSTRIISVGVSIALYVPISLKICQMKVASQKKIIFVPSTNTSSTRSSFQSVAVQKKTINFSITIGITCLSTFTFLFIPDLIINYNFFQLQNYHILFYRASLLKAIVNLFLYTFRHRELKKEIMLRFFNYYG